jgi:DinB superfamily
MRDRARILESLASQRAELVRRFNGFSAEELTRPCTASEHDAEGSWSPKDHLAHFLRIEEVFLAMAKRVIAGDERPLRFSGTTRAEILAGVHRDNDDHVVALREQTLAELLDALGAARAATLQFISELTDEQLDLPIAGAPWSDGTIGGVLSANGGHEMQHLSWIDEGLGKQPATR